MLLMTLVTFALCFWLRDVFWDNLSRFDFRDTASINLSLWLRAMVICFVCFLWFRTGDICAEKSVRKQDGFSWRDSTVRFCVLLFRHETAHSHEKQSVFFSDAYVWKKFRKFVFSGLSFFGPNFFIRDDVRTDPVMKFGSYECAWVDSFISFQVRCSRINEVRFCYGLRA